MNNLPKETTDTHNTHDTQSRTSLSSSISSIQSQHERHLYDEGFQDNVPVDLRTVTNDAVTRSISRIQSRISELDPSYEPASPELVKADSRNDDQFSRYSNKKKLVYLAIAASSGFLSPLNSLSILPAIPEISKAFHTTTEVINISNAVYCVFMSLSPCIISPCSDIYGRRPMFLICSVFYCISNALVAVSQNLTMFFIFRCMSALFGSSFFSIGGHIIGDIYHPTQRGRAVSLNVLGAQLGTGFGAFLGGLIVNFTTWRVILWVMMGLGVTVMLAAFFFLPETSVQTQHAVVLKEARKLNPKKKFIFVPFNPLQIMVALKFSVLAIDGFISMATIYTMFMLQTPIREVLEPRYNLTKPIYSGLFYLAPGLGYLVGGVFGGQWADWTVKKYIKIKGKRVPEDRLRTVLIPLGIMYPISTLIYGWTVQYAKGGMAVPLIFLFVGGVAQTCIFPASNAYCLDSLPELGGDGIGSSYFTRYIAAAVASATCLRSIQTIGLGWTCTITAFILWASFGCAIVLIYWGERMRVHELTKYGYRSKEDTEQETPNAKT